MFRAIVENGIVVNRIIAALGFEEGVLCGAEVQIGWSYSDGSFSPPPQEPEPLPTVEDYRVAIQALIDSAARSRNYNDGTALAGYKDCTVPQWSTEAIAFTAWRDAVWVYAYGELDKVTDGERTQPTVDDFLAELPAIDWPG
ncbi:hypothetical protein G6N74_29500 [Mesorhizobium sp. CGMCC 1.15528]|uniref:Uncharacterized protein n=1 Tax=Mesorhizobium zhangyense TaxID=1776730 RepID=A0A7C9VHK3_9HYPH|nr:hypothetical protein [Mesorhizobium zhangyense]NGN45192.1 hypothetical protein [Mesorhizobium zhangyense]